MAHDYEATSATTHAHDNIHAAVRVLVARRPFTAELDALATLLLGVCERHRVDLTSVWSPKCSCGALLEDLDQVCPDMDAVQDLADAVIDGDQSELVDIGVATAARGAAWIRDEQNGADRG